MEYRTLGRSGLQLSVLSLGSWASFGARLGLEETAECLAIAFDAGVNFVDTAESYAAGEAERVLGEALAQLDRPRQSYVLATKFWRGILDLPNMRQTLNRKYLLQAIDGSLARLGVDFIDIVYCHRPDPHTALEETVWTMHDIVGTGKALYWGTSEWPAEAIREAYAIAERHHLRPPVTEQAQYNLVNSERLETEYVPLRQTYGLGLTTWGPLASGILTGKYKDGVPEQSRLALFDPRSWLDRVGEPDVRQILTNLDTTARRLGCSTSQLAIAWCAANPDVTSVITGVTSAVQLQENLAAHELITRIDADVRERLTHKVV